MLADIGFNEKRGKRPQQTIPWEVYSGVFITMSNSDRSTGFKVVTVLTAILIASLVAVFLYDSGRKHGEALGEYSANSDTYARNTQEHIKECLALPEDGRKSKCIVKVVEASNEHERAEKDLIAQTEMALWALGMLVVSTLMMFVSALGVWWIRETLAETRNAVKAADDAVTVTRKIGESQLRAYCSVDSATLEQGNPDSGGDGYRKIYTQITIKNYGQTPAYDARGWIACNSYSRKEGKIRKLRREQPQNTLPLGPGATFLLKTPLVIRNEGELGDEQIFVIGFWRYKDCFGSARLTKIRYCLDIDRGELMPAQKGNVST